MNLKEGFLDVIDGGRDLVSNVLRSGKTIERLIPLKVVKTIFIRNGIVYGVNEPLYSIINPNLDLVKIPSLKRIFFNKGVLKDDKNREIVILTDESAETFDMRAYKRCLKYKKKNVVISKDAHLELQKPLNQKYFNDQKAEDIGYSIDFDSVEAVNIFKRGKEFSWESDVIYGSTYYSMIEEHPNQKILVAFIGGVLIGALFVSFATIGLWFLKG